MMRKLALLAAVVCLAATPAMAVSLTSATFGIAGVARISCGVTYRGTAETVVGIQIFDLAIELLDEDLTLSAESPATGGGPPCAPRPGVLPHGAGSPPSCRKTSFAPPCASSRSAARKTRRYSPPSSAYRWNRTVLDRVEPAHSSAYHAIVLLGDWPEERAGRLQYTSAGRAERPDRACWPPDSEKFPPAGRGPRVPQAANDPGQPGGTRTQS